MAFGLGANIAMTWPLTSTIIRSRAPEGDQGRVDPTKAPFFSLMSRFRLAKEASLARNKREKLSRGVNGDAIDYRATERPLPERRTMSSVLFDFDARSRSLRRRGTL